MDSKTQPLISVVTPVYNGEKFLAECIESVLAQTHENWEYVIVNNCSTDRTESIAQSYAEREHRICVYNTEEFLPIIKNWNHSLRLISPESQYCKVVHADDWLFPQCLEQMSDVAKENPTVGIVGAYRLKGTRVGAQGLPYPSIVTSGREICRLLLLDGLKVFGSPTTLLMRSDLVRSRRQFYNEANLHADLEACLDILQNSEFGFVHQVLTYTRHHSGRLSHFAKRLYTSKVGRYHVFMKYGPMYLSPKEYENTLRERTQAYYRFLAENLFRRRGRETLSYHRDALLQLGYSISWRRLAGAFFAFAIDRILNPKSTISGLINQRTAE